MSVYFVACKPKLYPTSLPGAMARRAILNNKFPPKSRSAILNFRSKNFTDLESQGNKGNYDIPPAPHSPAHAIFTLNKL